MRRIKRINLPPKELAAERDAVTQFLFDKCVPLKGSWQPIEMFFDGYKLWRKVNKMPKTILNIDGFGRVFPKAYKRGSAHWKPIKRSLKCVFGIVIPSPGARVCIDGQMSVCVPG